MQTKKIIGIALAAALLGSMATVAVAARDAVPDEELADYTKNHTFGIVGGMTSWADGADIDMTDADGDGVLIGVVRDLAAGDYEFKVRADGKWDDSWGMYEEEHDRTMNSQTNCKVTVTEKTDLIVALDTRGEDSALWPVSFVSTEKADASKFGIVGSMTSWADGADYPMYEVVQGIFAGVAKNVSGDIEFKVRADGKWDLSYGAYEADYDRTNNSQTNCKESIAAATETGDQASGSDLMVELNTTGDDDNLYPVSYTVYEGAKAVKTVYTGKEQEEETSEEEPITGRETVASDYIFFDNSETKWDEVYAYWWHPDYERTYDLENNDHGCVVVVGEDGTEGYEPTKFPGTRMEQVLDADGNPTDIWQIRIPFNAQKIIFSSGKSDDEVKNGETGYQTVDLDFNETENAGKIYKIDTSVEPKAGRGVEKTKYKYSAGSWEDYDGEFNSEYIGNMETPDEPTEESSVDPYETPDEPTEESSVDPYETPDEPTEESSEEDVSEEESLNPEDSSEPEGSVDDETSNTSGNPETSKDGEGTTTVETQDQPENSNTSGNADNTGSNGSTSGGSYTDAPATGDAAMAVAFIAVITAALGAVVLATKKKRI